MGQVLKAFSDLWDQTVQQLGWPAAAAIFAAGLFLAWLFGLLTTSVARRVDSRMPTGLGGFVVGSLAATGVGAAFLLLAFVIGNWFGGEFSLWRGTVGGAVFGLVSSLFRRKHAPKQPEAVKPQAEPVAAADGGGTTGFPNV